MGTTSGHPATARWGLVVAVLVATLLAACGKSSSTLDTGSVEHAIAASILAEHHVASTVVCPARVARRKGTNFTCAAGLEVGSYPLYVTETDAAGHVRFVNSTPLVLLDVTHVERAISAATLAQRRLHATVACPITVLQQTGLRFTCTATIGSRRYPFEVVEVNDSGRVRFVGR